MFQVCLIVSDQRVVDLCGLAGGLVGVLTKHTVMEKLAVTGLASEQLPGVWVLAGLLQLTNCLLFVGAPSITSEYIATLLLSEYVHRRRAVEVKERIVIEHGPQKGKILHP